MAGIPVQDELTPMGNYYLIRAKNVDVEGIRLDKVINQVKSSIEAIKTDFYTKAESDSKYASKTDVYTKSEVDTALNGKVSAQSGYGLISDADKAQIQTNKAGIAAAETAIAGKASQEEVNTIKSDVAGKASAEAVTQLQTEMDVQKARMDQLVEDPEVGVDEIADARIDNTGKTYANLGDRIRGTETSLKETINTTNNRISNIIAQSGTSDTEVVDARHSNVSDKTYDTLVDRLAVMENCVTPEMFGAKGDGTTDDTEAIQRAVNAHSVICFSAKTYLIRNNIIVTGTKTIYGNGAKIVSDVIPDTATSTGLIYAFDIENGRNITIDGFDFVNVFTGIRTHSCTGLKITNVRLATYRFAIELSNVFNFVVSQIYLEQKQKNDISSAANNFAWTDGVHVYGNSANGIIEHIYGTTCDDMVAIMTDEGTVNYGSKGNIDNIIIRDVKTVTKNILTNNEIYYPDASFGIVKVAATSAYNYTVSNVTIEDVCGKAFWEGGIMISLPNEGNKNITINRCKIDKTSSNHDIRSPLEISGSIDTLKILDSEFINSAASNYPCIDMANFKATSIEINGCKLLNKNKGAARYAFRATTKLQCDMFSVINCYIDDFYGFCNGYSTTDIFDINQYTVSDSYIRLYGKEDSVTNRTLCVLSSDTSFHGVYNTVHNIVFDAGFHMIIIANSAKIKKLDVDNIRTNEDYVKYIVLFTAPGTAKITANIRNCIRDNNVPSVVNTASSTLHRLVTRSALLSGAPTLFEANAIKNDIIESESAIYRFDGSHFVTM